MTGRAPNGTTGDADDCQIRFKTFRPVFSENECPAINRGVASPPVGTRYSMISGGERGAKTTTTLYSDRIPGIDFAAVVDSSEKNRSAFDTSQRPLPGFVGSAEDCFKFY